MACFVIDLTSRRCCSFSFSSGRRMANVNKDKKVSEVSQFRLDKPLSILSGGMLNVLGLFKSAYAIDFYLF